MKVINQKNYTYIGIISGLHAFMSNPDKVDFDKELVLVERAKFIKTDGKFEFFNSKSTIGESLLSVIVD